MTDFMKHGFVFITMGTVPELQGFSLVFYVTDLYLHSKIKMHLLCVAFKPKKIRTEAFGELCNVVLEENREDKMVRESNK